MPDRKPAMRAPWPLPGRWRFRPKMRTNGRGLFPDKPRDRPMDIRSLMKQESLHLPKPIAAYFSAEHAGAAAVGQCFTENAVVKDEAHTYHGQAAIQQWRTGVAAKYEYTSEPFACEEQGGKI